MNPADILLNAGPQALPHIAAGAVAGAIFIAALVYSPLFRSLALSTAALYLIFVVARDGLQGLLIVAQQVVTHAQLQRDLSKGLIIGAIMAGFLFARRSGRRYR